MGTIAAPSRGSQTGEGMGPWAGVSPLPREWRCPTETASSRGRGGGGGTTGCRVRDEVPGHRPPRDTVGGLECFWRGTVPWGLMFVWWSSPSTTRPLSRPSATLSPGERAPLGVWCASGGGQAHFPADLGGGGLVWCLWAWGARRENEPVPGVGWRMCADWIPVGAWCAWRWTHFLGV